MTWEPDEPGLLTLPSGRLIRGRAWSAPVGTPPDRGLYALWHDPAPTWPYRWLRWPDFGLPISRRGAWAAIEETWAAAGRERVEVACGGGRGRTGTILTAMAILDGLSPHEAVGWVRRGYQRGAVETPWQRRWLERR